MATKAKWYFLFLLLPGFIVASGQKVTLSGYIKDSSTNEFLIGATIQVVNSPTGVSSNAYGFYS
ncbi:MAG: hypothetical protein ACK5GV_11755, partial [Bacteroidota bacterium]